MIIKGIVVKGLGMGTKLGFPTANLDIYRGSTSGGSTSGVYVARVIICDQVTNRGDLVTYNAVAVVGARDDLAEVLLFDFQGDLYGKELEVELIKKVSEIEKFDNQEDLIQKIKNDIKLCSLG